MKAKVTYNNDGEVSEIKLTERSDTLAYANMAGSTAVITTVYPLKGHDGISGEEIAHMVEYLEELPFVQAATIKEVEA